MKSTQDLSILSLQLPVNLQLFKDKRTKQNKKEMVVMRPSSGETHPHKKISLESVLRLSFEFLPVLLKTLYTEVRFPKPS